MFHWLGKLLNTKKQPNQTVKINLSRPEPDADLISPSLVQNKKILNEIFNQCSHLVIREIQIGRDNSLEAMLVYLEPLVNAELVERLVLRPLMNITHGPIQGEQRLEILIVVIWVAGAVIKLAIFLHSSCIALANLLGIKNWRMTIIPIALTMVIIAHFFYDTYPKLISFLTDIWPVYALTIELLIPGLVLIIAVLRKKGVNNVAQVK